MDARLTDDFSVIEASGGARRDKLGNAGVRTVRGFHTAHYRRIYAPLSTAFMLLAAYNADF